MDGMSTTARTQGAHHVGLTVPDLRRAKQFFIDVLGFEQIGDVPAYPAVFVSDGSIMITLWQAADPANAVAFDRKNHIGLHHLALKVESAEALDKLHRILRGIDDVEIEFAPESLGDGPARHMMTYMPGGIRIEYFAAG
jgi:catechol 2,3-dioxygenase-like lactoylglutathione lyase family enzyme